MRCVECGTLRPQMTVPSKTGWRCSVCWSDVHPSWRLRAFLKLSRCACRWGPGRWFRRQAFELYRAVYVLTDGPVPADEWGHESRQSRA